MAEMSVARPSEGGQGPGGNDLTSGVRLSPMTSFEQMANPVTDLHLYKSERSRSTLSFVIPHTHTYNTSMSPTQTSTTATTTSSLEQSSTISIPGARKVKGVISYLDRSVTKPYQYLCEPPAGEPRNNFVKETVEKDITDLAGTSSSEREAFGFTTDGAGFQIVDDAWTDSRIQKEWRNGARWESEDWIQKTYYPEVDALLKKQLGVTSTFIFDHTIRKSQTSHLPDDPANRKPVAQAHCDQSRLAGENRILKHLGQDVLDRVLKGELKAQLINVWRPMWNVEEYPLAVADSRTVYRGEKGGAPDWVESELRYETWSGQTLLITHRPEHRWYYYKGITPDQVILLKCYDSNTETRTPHTAFVDPSTAQDARPRCSMEARVLCLTETGKTA